MAKFNALPLKHKILHPQIQGYYFFYPDLLTFIFVTGFRANDKKGIQSIFESEALIFDKKRSQESPEI